MFVYAPGTKERSRAKHVLAVNFNGKPDKVEFDYGLARVEPALGEYLIGTGRAARSFRDWGMHAIADGARLPTVTAAP
jgi:hypothetical protein